MKDLLLKSTKTLALLAAMVGVISLNSCSDDTEEPTPNLVEDGFYIQGDASAYADYDIKATLKSTRNEVINSVDGVLTDPRPELMEIFVALKAGGTFNIMQVAGSERTKWGPAADFADVTEGTTDEPQVTFQRGGIEASETGFTVPADGLYHVVIDTEVGKAAIVPVNWTIIGQATPGGWSGGTAMDASAFDMNTMTWSLTDVTMSGGEWKFRYSDGWKVEIDTAYDLGGGDKGIKVNTNLGNATEKEDFMDLEPGGFNYNSPSGIYNISITWTAGEGFSAVVDKTADIPPRDYSAVVVGIVGDGAEGSIWPVNATDETELAKSTPSKDMDVYTWNFNSIKLLSAGGFKFRTSGTWDDINVGYSSDIVGGPNADDIQESGGNFQAKADGTFDIEFIIDSANDGATTVNFTKQ
jgi:hypothetical protein